MTIRLLATYQGYAPNTILTLAPAVEASLLAGGVNATTDLSGGVPPSYTPPAVSVVTPKLAVGVDGVPIGLVDSTGTIVSVFAGIAAPGAPTGLTLTAIAGGVVAAFTAPAANGGTAITGYEVTLSNGRVQRGAGTTIPVNSPAGQAVTATVKAINGYTTGAASAASNSVTPTGVVTPSLPGAPTIGTLVAGDGKVTVNWTAAAANGSPITGYTVLLSNGTSAQAGANATSLDVNTANGVAVTATVRAINGVGTGPASAISNSVTPSSFTPDVDGASLYTVEIIGYGFPPRLAIADANRTMLKLRHKAGPIMEVGVTADPNSTQNGPSSFVALGIGRELLFDATDRVKQIYARTAASVTRAVTAVTFPNVNTARATLTAHGFTTGDLKSFTGFVDNTSSSSRRLNQAQVPITVIDADTFEWPLSTPVGASAAVTTLGRVYDGSGLIEVEMIASN